MHFFKKILINFAKPCSHRHFVPFLKQRKFAFSAEKKYRMTRVIMICLLAIINFYTIYTTQLTHIVIFFLTLLHKIIKIFIQERIL